MKAILPSESRPSVVKEALSLRASALAGFDDKRGGERKTGEHRSGDGSPYTWAGGEGWKFDLMLRDDSH